MLRLSDVSRNFATTSIENRARAEENSVNVMDCSSSNSFAPGSGSFMLSCSQSSTLSETSLGIFVFCRCAPCQTSTSSSCSPPQHRRLALVPRRSLEAASPSWEGRNWWHWSPECSHSSLFEGAATQLVELADRKVHTSSVQYLCMSVGPTLLLSCNGILLSSWYVSRFALSSRHLARDCSAV